MLGNFLSDCRNIKVKHATTDGDADIVIVVRALKAAQTYSEVMIYSEDTDILVLLLHHTQVNKVFNENKNNINKY